MKPVYVLPVVRMLAQVFVCSSSVYVAVQSADGESVTLSSALISPWVAFVVERSVSVSPEPVPP